MRHLLWTLPALLLLTACQRPEVEAFKRDPAPIVVEFSVPASLAEARAREVKGEYAAALRARLATRTMVVPERVQAPDHAARLKVEITELHAARADRTHPAAVGVATGVAVGTLSALVGSRDAIFDGFFWGLWAGHQAAYARQVEAYEQRRLGFWPQRVEARVSLVAAGHPEPLLVFVVDPREVIDAMDPLPRSEREDEGRILEEEARAFARVVVQQIQSRFGWMVLGRPSWWGVTDASEARPVAPLPLQALPKDPGLKESQPQKPESPESIPGEKGPVAPKDPTVPEKG